MTKAPWQTFTYDFLCNMTSMGIPVDLRNISVELEVAQCREAASSRLLGEVWGQIVARAGSGETKLDPHRPYHVILVMRVALEKYRADPRTAAILQVER